MIKKIKATIFEKIIFVFLILLAIFALSFTIIIKNKCLFIKDINLQKINFEKPENIAILNVECGKVIIELYPELSPNAVKRFKKLIKSNAYNNVAFHRVIKNKLVQAGDIEFGKKNNLDYGKIGTGKSGLGTIKSEVDCLIFLIIYLKVKLLSIFKIFFFMKETLFFNIGSFDNLLSIFFLS